MSLFRRKSTFWKLLRESLVVVFAVILIWRGTWILLDMLDQRLFGGSHAGSALFGIAIGFVLIYIAEKDLDDVI